MRRFLCCYKLCCCFTKGFHQLRIVRIDGEDRFLFSFTMCVPSSEECSLSLCYALLHLNCTSQWKRNTILECLWMGFVLFDATIRASPSPSHPFKNFYLWRMLRSCLLLLHTAMDSVGMEFTTIMEWRVAAHNALQAIKVYRLYTIELWQPAKKEGGGMAF